MRHELNSVSNTDACGLRGAEVRKLLLWEAMTRMRSEAAARGVDNMLNSDYIFLKKNDGGRKAVWSMTRALIHWSRSKDHSTYMAGPVTTQVDPAI